MEWARLCGVLGLADTATDARFASAAAREEHAAELVAILEPAFRTLDAAEWFRLLDEQGVPCEIAAEDFAETWYDDPDVIANAWVVKYQHPSFGTTEQYGRLFSFSEMPEQNLAPPPEIGQHTREILTDLGYDDAGIAALHKAAVVANCAGAPAWNGGRLYLSPSEHHAPRCRPGPGSTDRAARVLPHAQRGGDVT